MRKTSTLGMDVDLSGRTFLMENMGKDCPPLQQIRELTQNSIEAILRGGYGSGTIVWDYDQPYFEQTGIYKLSITDDGVGMDGKEVKKYINSLSSSGGTQSFDKNFGIGAKVSAATRNKAGVIYQSWKEGKESGIMAVLWKDPKSECYGLKALNPNASDEHILDITHTIGTEIIKHAGHGTKVILVGNSEDENTMENADTTSKIRAVWLPGYLNSRYYKFPLNITVKARESWDTNSPRLRTVTGMHQHLESNSDSRGSVPLTDAVVHWWVLSKERSAGGNLVTSGHVAALYQNELYNFMKGKTAIAMLQQFGVAAAMSRVVLYIEPKSSYALPNLVRTELQLNGERLPWEEYAEEFRAALPAEIQKLIDDAVSNLDRNQDAIDILDKIKELFNFPGYRRNSNGEIDVINSGVVRGNQLELSRGEGHGGDDENDPFLSKLDAYIKSQKKTEIKGESEDSVAYPTVMWIDAPEEYGISDRAASYVSATHVIYANSKFRGFTSLIEFAATDYGDPTAATIAEIAMKKLYKLALMETVLGILSIHKGSKEWSADDKKSSLSPEALTTAMMQRYHQLNQIKRDLTNKCGRRRHEFADQVG